MRPDELLPRGLASLLGVAIVWLGWALLVITTQTTSLPVAAAVGVALSGAVWFLFWALHRAAGLPDPAQVNLAIGAFSVLAGIGLVLAWANGFYDRDFLADLFIVAGQAAASTLLAFSIRTALAVVPVAVAMAAVGLSDSALVVVTLVGALYLEAKPPSWLGSPFDR